jgi:cation/acetate symporter
MNIYWLGLLQLFAMWLAIVFIATKAMDWLYPRMKRGDTQPTLLDPLPWYPAPRRVITQTTLPTTTPTNPLFWKANLRVILVLLILWFAASFGPVLISPILNQTQVLTGFPLGYYMSGQGSLLIFLGIATAYAWRVSRIERELGHSNDIDVSDQSRQWRLGRNLVVFATLFAMTIGLVSMLETSDDVRNNTVVWFMMAITVGVYAVIGFVSRTKKLDDYFVAGRNIPALFNGLAIAGDWMSAATFISLAGTLWLLGYEGLAYILGWTGGYVILAMLLAPYLRKFGQFTIPDFIAARYEGNLARIVSAIIAIIISFTYVTAQVSGIGIIMSRFLGVNFVAGVVFGLGSVLFCSFLGGMRAITWTQVAQCIVIIFAFLAPVTILSYKFTGVPIPQLMYGTALNEIVKLEQLQGIANSYVQPFNDWSPLNFMALMLCLMLGTAGLPHILIRFYTVPDASSARKSSAWGLLFIVLIYITIPAYAAFSRWEVLQNVVGKKITDIPAWATNWEHAGLVKIDDVNNDGVLQFRELKIDQDVVVLATPEIAGLPKAIAALVVAGGLAAALSTADGLLLVIASALSHDIYAKTINPAISLRRRLLFGRAAVFVAAILAGITAMRRLGIITQLVAWAFSLAAATFFPVLVLGIFWKRANGRGAVTGMVSGGAVTLVYMIVNYATGFNILGISHVAAGVFGMAVNFLVTIVVSLRSNPPSAETSKLTEMLRQP